MKRLLGFLDDYLISIIAGFLMIFIPLYPKLPLFDAIPGYIVRVRLEDLLILITLIFYSVWVLRGKAVFWQTPLTKPMLIYTSIGFASVVSALFISQTVPLHAIHVEKLFLHFFRRIEYFSLFFIFFSSTRSLKQVKVYVVLFILAMAGVTAYGYGQKYLYWPAYSTMNREFAKGWTLYLTEHARVLSTFGGHYDLAAFTMMALAYLWSLLFGLKNRFQKIIVGVVLASSFWLIILTASRVSFIAYLVALTLVVFLWAFQKGVKWGISRWSLAIGLSVLIMLSFGDLSDRFMRLFRFNERLGGIRALVLRPAVKPPTENVVYLENSLANVTSKSDMPPSPLRPGAGTEAVNQPADVTQDVPEWEDTTIAADGSIRVVQKKRVYSKTALQFDLSTGIRLDALWPRAWQGFTTNPLLGTGYSTLTKSRVTDFTEAESTDNGYLRALGETGMLGSISFFAIIFTLLFSLFNALGGIKDPIFFAAIAGGIASIVGLLVNASYIDIFEASKVALPFWSLAGVLLGGIMVEKNKIDKNWQPLKLKINWHDFFAGWRRLIRSDAATLLIILILSFFLRLQKLNTPLADWHSWRQADTSAVTRNFDRFGINLLYPTFDDLSSVASGMPNPRGLRMVEFPIYNAIAVWVKKLLPELTIEAAGRLTSIFTSLGSIVFLFLITRKYLGKRVGFLTALAFAIIPYNIFYSRVTLPEPFLVFSSLAMIYFFDRWLAPSPAFGVASTNEVESLSRIRRITIYLLAFFFASVSLLIKPYAAFLFIPMLFLVYQYRGLKGFVQVPIGVFFFASLVPFALWRLWISQFPEGIPAYTWLLNGDGIRFKGAFFFWIFADRIGRLILGYWGLVPFAVGLILKRDKATFLFHIWFLSIVIYLFTFATGNVRHDYYQILIIPIISIFLALGLDYLFFQKSDHINHRAAQFTAVSCFIFLFMFGWYHIRDFYNINHPEIVAAGQAVREKTHWRAKVIAPYSGDTAFLYQTERFGWPLMEGTIAQMIDKGAQYYVSVNHDELTQSLMAFSRNPDLTHPYKLIIDDPKFTIIQLVPDSHLPKD